MLETGKGEERDTIDLKNNALTLYFGNGLIFGGFRCGVPLFVVILVIY